MSKDGVTHTPWSALRNLTPARIALGRAGTSLPTKPHLDFQLAHARARKAVHLALDVPSLIAQLAPLGLPVLSLQSAAESRAVYLQRPDLGRRLADLSRTTLAPVPGGCDVAVVIGDGLSATAIAANAVPFLSQALPLLQAQGWSLGPLSIVTQARVAVGDEVGAALGARMVLVLIGERPGLSSPDSMGLYLTHGPRVGLTDEARNCISNVRVAGLSYAEATHKLIFLMTQAHKLGLTGVQLKDEAEALVAIEERPNFLISH
ncbi:ethanolamine ammonia-lyase subunit EutC (plasmid) [Paracoccus sp. Arc7-R13]|uniref:ethanolamine ammonia-lyase subunit EutC n=1 Tax=Paracoccus sp. Arc7-R13 TaxID=2500532 RepID=UPI000FD8951D|nr:ethanolamine ammonia-lyase subunit EutC [Paracoccus sp. Arc7-R13]AZY95526.1 ethanolamine ammonia-lyase subunit EutC [Paracoccus sp. Arc7-R13]